MPSPKKPFRLNVGFIAHEEIGRSHNFLFEFEQISLSEDFSLRNFSGAANISRTPQGLFVQADFAANITLECARCLTEFDQRLAWSFSELYAFDARSETDSGLILPEDGHIDLAELLRDYALLEVPISPICKEDCQGLCIECGQNLNEKDCGHKQEDDDSPFSVLKKLL
ncbi:MAG: hypothetical protein Fur002_15760 [Anaerolineales bacterium]